MPTPPLVSERFTAGIGGIHMMPQLGFIGENGRNGGFNPDVPLDQLHELFCGPNLSYCTRFAKALAALPPPARWAQLGGGFGNVYPANDNPEYRAQHRAITLQCFGEYIAACKREGVSEFGSVVDDENEYPRKNADDLYAILYDSGLLNPKTSRCVGWFIYDGIGNQKNEWGPAPKTRGLIDGRTACVHGYLRRDIGVSLDDQVAQIVAQAEGSRKAGFDFVPLVTGATHNQEGKPYNIKEREAYQTLAGLLNELNPVAVWIANYGGQGSPAPLRRKGDPDSVIDGNWEMVMQESLATVDAWSN